MINHVKVCRLIIFRFKLKWKLFIWKWELIENTLSDTFNTSYLKDAADKIAGHYCSNGQKLLFLPRYFLLHSGLANLLSNKWNIFYESYIDKLMSVSCAYGHRKNVNI